MDWHTGGHPNSLVPLFVRGDAAGLFATEVVALDPVRGGYVDNTAIARVVAVAMAPAAIEHRTYGPLLAHEAVGPVTGTAPFVKWCKLRYNASGFGA